MTALDNLVVTTALPSIRKDLGATLAGLEWTVNAYTLTFAVLLITGAALGDRFGRRRLFVDRPRDLHRRLRRRGARARRSTSADRRPRGPGRRRRDRDAADADDPAAAVPAEKRGIALGAWGGIAASPSRSARSSAARSPSGISWQWIFWLNVPIGLVADPARALPPARDVRPDGAARPAGRRASPASACSASSGASSAATRIGWGRARDRLGSIVGSARAPGGFRALGAAHRGADAADALLPQPRLLGRERRVAR